MNTEIDMYYRQLQNGYNYNMYGGLISPIQLSKYKYENKYENKSENNKLLLLL